MPVSLRKATIDDAPFLARCLMEAMGGLIMEHYAEGTITQEEKTIHRVLTLLAQREDTLYTWRHGTIAQIDDIPVGASIAYRGEEYHERQRRSFALASKILSFDIEKMEDEAVAGEYYLDTLAVEPSFRNKGIGHILLNNWLREAEELKLLATLIYAKGNTHAKEVYESIGMRDDRPIFVFGEYYEKMVFGGRSTK